MNDRNKRLSLIIAILGGPLVTVAAAILLVPDLRGVLRRHDFPIVLIVVLVSVVIYQLSMGILARRGQDSKE